MSDEKKVSWQRDYPARTAKGSGRHKVKSPLAETGEDRYLTVVNPEHVQYGEHTTNRKAIRARRAPRKDPLEMIEVDGVPYSRWQVRAAIKQWTFNKNKARRRAANKVARKQRKVNA